MIQLKIADISGWCKQKFQTKRCIFSHFRSIILIFAFAPSREMIRIILDWMHDDSIRARSEACDYYSEFYHQTSSVDMNGELQKFSFASRINFITRKYDVKNVRSAMTSEKLDVWSSHKVPEWNWKAQVSASYLTAGFPIFDVWCWAFRIKLLRKFPFWQPI